MRTATTIDYRKGGRKVSTRREISDEQVREVLHGYAEDSELMRERSLALLEMLEKVVSEAYDPKTMMSLPDDDSIPIRVGLLRWVRRKCHEERRKLG
jgi:hypothetical protein